MVIEMKHVPKDSSDDTSISKAHEALDQIKNKDYLHGLKGNTLLYGISFRNKKTTVVSEKTSLRV